MWYQLKSPILHSTILLLLVTGCSSIDKSDFAQSPSHKHHKHVVNAPSTKRMLLIAKTYEQQGYKNRAIKAYESVVATYPQTAQAQQAEERLLALNSEQPIPEQQPFGRPQTPNRAENQPMLASVEKPAITKQQVDLASDDEMEPAFQQNAATDQKQAEPIEMVVATNEGEIESSRSESPDSEIPPIPDLKTVAKTQQSDSEDSESTTDLLASLNELKQQSTENQEKTLDSAIPTYKDAPASSEWATSEPVNAPAAKHVVQTNGPAEPKETETDDAWSASGWVTTKARDGSV